MIKDKQKEEIEMIRQYIEEKMTRLEDILHDEIPCNEASSKEYKALWNSLNQACQVILEENDKLLNVRRVL